MKDTILNSALIACAFSAFLVSVIDDSRLPAQAAVAQGNNVVNMEKTVVAGRRLPSNVTLVAAIAR